MRIIAGTRRNHHFEGPLDRATRPTSDRAREAIFNILADSIEDLLAVDLFSGTGSLGLEALSRGASRAIFVEKNRGNAALIRRNLITLRFEDRAVVHNTDAFRWARSYRPEPNEPAVLFLDPPWREYENYPDRIPALIQIMLTRLPVGSIVVVESDKQGKAEPFADSDLWDHRHYGGTRVSVRRVGVEESIVSAVGDETEPEPDLET